MILVWGGREGRWVDWDLWNPYSIGANHQNGANLIQHGLAAIPGMRCACLPQGKLALHEEFPDAVAQAIVPFLAEGK